MLNEPEVHDIGIKIMRLKTHFHHFVPSGVFQADLKQRTTVTLKSLI